MTMGGGVREARTLLAGDGGNLIVNPPRAPARRWARYAVDPAGLSAPI